MKDAYVFLENGEILAVYDNFIKFRKETFHYILDFLIHENNFKTRIEAGKKLKKNFMDFYGKDKIKLVFGENNWECKKLGLNNLENKFAVVVQEEVYISKWKKVNVKGKGFTIRTLMDPIKYVDLTSLYEK